MLGNKKSKMLGTNGKMLGNISPTIFGENRKKISPTIFGEKRNEKFLRQFSVKTELKISPTIFGHDKFWQNFEFFKFSGVIL